jgi:hypothetical protein
MARPFAGNQSNSAVCHRGVFPHAVMQERTTCARTQLDQLAASTHTAYTEISDQPDRGPPFAHSIREENAGAIEQFTTLTVSDGGSTTDAIDTMLADRLSWCQPPS